MASINLGNIVDGKAVGVASNIDSSAIIKDLEAIKRKPIDDINANIEKNLQKTEKYSELKNLLNTFQDALGFLRNSPESTLNPFANAFDYRTVSLSSATLLSSDYLSVTTNPGAVVGDVSIEIGALAEALEQRSGSFNARNTSATTAATGSYFSAGTFQVGSGIVKDVTGDTLDGFELSSSNYSVIGNVSGIVSSIDNFNVVGASGGLTGLQGGISVFSSSYSDGDLTISFVKDDIEYTSNVISADDSINGGANTGISSGSVITFTGDSGGDNETSFDITIGSDVIIDGDSGNVTSFLDDMVSGLSDVSIYQARQISNFDNSNVKSPLNSLTSDDIEFVSDGFNLESGEFGTIGSFEVQSSSGADGIISVKINGEDFRISGLGTTVNTNIVLESTTTDKELRINLGDAGESIDLSSDTAALEFKKSLEYAFGTRELTEITVEEGDSLNNIIFDINQKSPDTGLSASLIQVSEFDYRVSLKASNEGIENSYEFFDPSGVLTNANISTVQQASNAIFKVDGIEIERPSNTITDAVDSSVLELKKVTPNYDGLNPDNVNVSTKNDIDIVVGKVVEFLDAYNAIKVFDAKQNFRSSDSSFAEDSVLGGDNILETLINQVSSQLSGLVSGAEDLDFDALSDVGIITRDFAGDAETTATSNILSYDENKLREHLTANFDKVRDVFELQVSTSDANLRVLEVGRSSILDFQLRIDTDAESGQQVQLLNADGSDYKDEAGEDVYLDLENGVIKGKSGTDVEGLELLYIGSGSSTISVDINQGIADKLFNVVEPYTESGGVIDATVEGLAEEDRAGKEEIVTLEVRVASYVASLRAQYNALEASIASVNNILSFLDAQDAARNAK